jgi:hypothetical protein
MPAGNTPLSSLKVKEFSELPTNSEDFIILQKNSYRTLWRSNKFTGHF